MKIGTCNEYFENWPIEEVFNYAAEVGYDGVEIAPFTLANSVEEISQSRRLEIRRHAENAGIEIIGLHWLLISPKGLYTNHIDDQIRNITRDYFKSLIGFCGDLGGSVMIIGSPQQRNVQDGWDFDATWNRTKSVFEDCLLLAEENSVKVYNNVSLNYVTGSLRADKIDYDFETKFFKVSMFDDNSIKMKVTQ